MEADTDLQKLFRLTPVQVQGLKKLGILSVRDLLYHFPTRYDEAGGESAIRTLAQGESVTVFGTIGKLQTRRSWKRRIPVGEALITDASGTVKVMWFHQPYIAKKFSEGQFVKAVGVASGTGKPYLANPHVELADPAEAGILTQKAKAGQLFAVYPESRGITSLWFRHAIQRLLDSETLREIEDPIPSAIRDRYHLPSLSDALVWIHTPEKLGHAQSARKRFSFEEIFTIQVAQAIERASSDSHPAFSIPNGQILAEKFILSQPITPTGAQRRATGEILADFARGTPMARLLEGDVGSGKTLVAAATAYAVVNSRPPGRQSGTLQVAYMAPTEILAQQHFQSFIRYFKHLPINIALITGSGCEKFPSKLSKDRPTDISRAQLLKWVESGEITMLCGTHALIQKSVKFQHLAYAIVDEQHRFGTRQRALLAKKNDSSRVSEEAPTPHFLSMTATPIPRTLALTLYGDLDLSLLDELPPGRVKIKTTIVQPSGRSIAYAAIREELQVGRQAYVICPRIDEPDPSKIGALIAKSVKAEAARLKEEVFPEFEIGVLHGAMKAAEKDSVMVNFSAGKIHILVATSVVEVGINVPNATVILIEGAERFGLAQLHQLRGRVQRSSHPPQCFLLAESKGEAALKRLKVLAQSDDGFKLAEADLEARGSGDLYGKKQWGVSDIGMEALRNLKLIQAARTEAQELVQNDTTLSKHPALAARAAAVGAALHGE